MAIPPRTLATIGPTLLVGEAVDVVGAEVAVVVRVEVTKTTTTEVEVIDQGKVN